MKRLVQTLATIIRNKANDNIKGTGAKIESRFIFHGPPLDMLEEIFTELTGDGGILVLPDAEGMSNTLPVLLQLPRDRMAGANPRIGESGKCDESHLLHIRNDPNSASYVALMPPGQHTNMSVASTTEEFGISASCNTGHAAFEEWWKDGFVQYIVREGLRLAGIEPSSFDEATAIVELAAAAVDEVEPRKGGRDAAWRLFSRIYSIGEDLHGLAPGSALSLACGVPPMADGSIAAKVQLETLKGVADELADGFKIGIDGLVANGSVDTTVKDALAALLTHVRANCEIPTSFERSTAAFYLPSNTFALEPPPIWWQTLTVECWAELLFDEPDQAGGDLQITCTNPIIPIGRGMPAIVRAGVELEISSLNAPDVGAIDVLMTGGSFGKQGTLVTVDGIEPRSDSPPSSGQRSPISYKVTAAGRKAAAQKVISLASWIPGIVVTCRIASKLSPPKKPRKGSTGINWESSLALPGPGRYELIVLVASGVTLVGARGVADDATEQLGEEPQPLVIHSLRTDEYQLEIEAEGKFQLEISFQLAGQRAAQTCRIYISCEETKEEGCKSEFERLIKLNRRHLDKFDAKAIVQLDRHARLSSLQSWMLDEQNVSNSFLPVVLADDYAAQWTSPDWSAAHGPILSQARFLHDPRPPITLFKPPAGFVEARIQIAARVRETSDLAGLLESAPLGKWMVQDESFRVLVEAYLDAYMAWFATDRDVACWVDAIAVCSRESQGRTLSRVPDAIILSPLHPLRLAWHCLAQRVLYSGAHGDTERPCPAASILDPDCIPDLLAMSLQAPGGPTGIELVNFLSVECSSDYWSVLWNGTRLREIADESRQAPFDNELGLVVGGISSGFSPAQVGRALEDVSDLLAAKPIISLVVSSAGGATDACNDGLANWCLNRFGSGDKAEARQLVGPRMLEVFDTRPVGSRPDQATIANLSEDTSNSVRWYDKQPAGTNPDLGIIAQLDSAQPECTTVGMGSPLSMGGLIRHRVRRQLHGAFVSESRQGLSMPASGDIFGDKVAACIVAMEKSQQSSVGLQFAPNVHAIAEMLEKKRAGFVAVSSSAIDPACFLGGWIKGAYLWDYDLPSYSHRAGDTSGYYLLSQVKEADRDAIRRALQGLSGGNRLSDAQVDDILLEVARRGIPTVRGLSGDDTGATGDLGLFLAVRLLQDKFRVSGNLDSVLPVLAGTAEDAIISIIVPVDPFRGYLSDLARSLGNDRREVSLSRPDLLVIGIHATESAIRLHLTPVEVKCRQQNTIFSPNDARDALAQAKSMSSLLARLSERAAGSPLWELAYKHLLLSMVGFGLRVYSQQEGVANQAARWASYHERIVATILSPGTAISIDPKGRLIVVDGSESEARDHDGDGFDESIFISPKDAWRIVAGDAQNFYDKVRAKVGTWSLLPTGVMHAPYEAAAIRPALLPCNQEGNPACVPVLDELEGPRGLFMLDTPEECLPALTVLPLIEVGEPSDGIVLSLGQTVDGFEPRSLALNLSDTRLNQLNIGVVGDLGTGKTQLLKSLILQIAIAHKENRGVKPRFLIFDYKRDYSSPEFLEATGARVVKPTRLPLNLFDTTCIGESVAPWLDRFRFFADVLDKVYTGIGPVQRDKLKGAVRSAYEACASQGRPPTIYDIHSEYRDLLAGKSDSPMSIIDDLVDMQIFEMDPAKTKPFDQFLDGIVVVSLDAMGQDDRSKNMLVAIMLNMFYENMLKVPKRPFLGTAPQLRVIDSYLLVDEADNIMRYEFDVLRKLLLQGREFGTGVILASQYLRHFKTAGTDYREPLLTWFIHKVPNVTPAELGALGFTSDLGDLSERVKTLPNHHCLYKSFDSLGEIMRGLPFYELTSKAPNK
ncbi:ATP-binding protein [Massilia rubra]|uniref:ATP-binding protein n=1 Tax=Massilia rubra TaxID=2607910 RepID=A0ABX0LE17_9BURK|nr:ATP-binding protein [Massilia rubra]NHZ32984.1 ATP-binding protein [Massilia rubra]